MVWPLLEIHHEAGSIDIEKGLDDRNLDRKVKPVEKRQRASGWNRYDHVRKEKKSKQEHVSRERYILITNPPKPKPRSKIQGKPDIATHASKITHPNRSLKPSTSACQPSRSSNVNGRRYQPISHHK